MDGCFARVRLRDSSGFANSTGCSFLQQDWECLSSIGCPHFPSTHSQGTVRWSAWKSTCFGKGTPWRKTREGSCPPLQEDHARDLGGKATSAASAAGGSAAIRLPALLPCTPPALSQLGRERHPAAQPEGKAFGQRAGGAEEGLPVCCSCAPAPPSNQLFNGSGVS